MKRAGRIHWMVIAGLLGVCVFVGLLFFGREGPDPVANQFMVALKAGDVDKLTDLSYFPNGDRAELRKQWEFATQVAGKYYSFAWQVKYSKIASDENASVALSVWRNVTDPSTYDENFQLPMVRENGKWYVDVRSIGREMYPALPR